MTRRYAEIAPFPRKFSNSDIVGFAKLDRLNSLYFHVFVRYRRIKKWNLLMMFFDFPEEGNSIVDLL
jgi:hypothetical protein